MKTFNTAGPVKPDKHYNIPALSRWDTDEIRCLIREERYFVLHAPRQTGKTSCLLALMEQLSAEADYTALYANLEPAQAARGNVEAGIMHTIISGIAEDARRYLGDQRPREWVDETLHGFGPHGALRGLLSRWSEENDRPIVLLLDEVDSLVRRYPDLPAAPDSRRLPGSSPGLSPDRAPVRGPRRAGLPHPQRRQPGHHRRQRL